MPRFSLQLEVDGHSMPSLPPSRQRFLYARAQVLKVVGGQLVSPHSKTGNPACSRAVSDWKLGKATHDTHKQLAQCRAEARGKKAIVAQRGAGQEARAQHLEHRMAGGQPLTAAARGAKAHSRVFERATRNKARQGRSEAEPRVTASPPLRMPRVGEKVRVDGATYLAEPVDSDDTFPPAVASYEVKDGHVFYRGRDGSEGVVTGTQSDLEKWMRQVDAEVASRPPARDEIRDWHPEHGGGEHIAKARAAAYHTAAVFGLRRPQIRFGVGPRAMGEHQSEGHLSVVNAHLDRPASFIFPTPGVTQGAHLAAHETVHRAVSSYPELAQEMIGRLRQLRSHVSLYAALAGDFESLVELGAAYTTAPGVLRRHDPRLHSLAHEFATRSRAASLSRA